MKRPGRILAGHLWIFSNELSTSPKQYEPGSVVEVYTKNDFIGIGYINPHSLISVRLLTREKEQIDRDFFFKRIKAAMDFRKRFLLDDSSFRVVYSEGDLLPGLIVDKYSDCIVIQFLTLGMDKMKDVIIDIIDDIFSPSTIVIRNDSHSRILEGLPMEKGIIKGSLEMIPVINEGGVFFEVDPISGQKTGFFLDQRENRIALRSYIKGGIGLDLFCYTGSWGLHLSKNGSHVIFVDSSEKAISMVKRNAELNNLVDRSEFIIEDVFDFLKKEASDGNLYDFIILDPPAFVKSKSRISEALRGYREINSLAMKIVRKNGILATSSCSYHIDRTAFIDMLRNAARDSGRNARIIENRMQSRDHPILLTVPETDYLKCVFLELFA